MCKPVLKVLATRCYACYMGIKSCWTKFEKEVEKKEGKKKEMTKVLPQSKEVTELQIVENYVVSWGEWQKIFLYDCPVFHCSLRHLLLVAPGDGVVGQAGYLVWASLVIPLGLNIRSGQLCNSYVLCPKIFFFFFFLFFFLLCSLYSLYCMSESKELPKHLFLLRKS